MNKFTFNKNERIVSRKLMDNLFTGNRSHSLAAFPLKAVFAEKESLPGEEPVQILVSVPKKRFKHAVDRNRVKRQVREAYRLQKHLLIEQLAAGQAVVIAFIWLSDNHFPSSEIHSRVKSLLLRIRKSVSAVDKQSETSD